MDGSPSRNVEALRPVYEKWAQGQWRWRPEVYADDFEWGYSAEFPEAGIATEPNEKSDRLREFLSSWEDWRCEAEEYIEVGDKVVVLAHYTGRAKTSGVEVVHAGAHVWTMRDGRAVRLEVFSDRKRALAAAGA